jgi:hypothetical protein
MDLNVRAFRTVQAALDEPAPVNKRKQAARKGGLVGGKSRANTLTPDRKREIALAANAARWGHNTPANSSQGKERQ